MTEAEQRRLLALLAPAVQHDANNMMTVVMATLDLMRGGASPELLAKRVERIDVAAKRIDGLMRGYLMLARQPPGEVRRVDIAALLHGLAPLLRLAMGPQTRLTLDAPSHGVEVSCDAAALGAALADGLREVAEAVVRLVAEGVLLEIAGEARLLRFGDAAPPGGSA